MDTNRYKNTVEVDDMVIEALLEYLQVKKHLKGLTCSTVNQHYVSAVGKDLRCLEHMIRYFGVTSIEQECNRILFGFQRQTA